LYNSLVAKVVHVVVDVLFDDVDAVTWLTSVSPIIINGQTVWFYTAHMSVHDVVCEQMGTCRSSSQKSSNNSNSNSNNNNNRKAHVPRVTLHAPHLLYVHYSHSQDDKESCGLSPKPPKKGVDGGLVPRAKKTAIYIIYI
jgi:hypothetical protein